jgi:hypothetical protein
LGNPTKGKKTIGGEWDEISKKAVGIYCATRSLQKGETATKFLKQLVPNPIIKARD